MNKTMTDSEKLDYAIEMLEAIQQKQEQQDETIEELCEKVSDLDSNFGDGFERGEYSN